MKSIVGTIFGAMLTLALGAGTAAVERDTVTGEVIDTWCYLSEIMFPLGTAHHQCAIWCAAGGIPVGLLDEDERVYIILSIENDSDNVANPTMLEIQSHQVTVEGEVFERDGITYLTIDKLVNDEGVVNRTADAYGIQPFGE